MEKKESCFSSIRKALTPNIKDKKSQRSKKKGVEDETPSMPNTNPAATVSQNFTPLDQPPKELANPFDGEETASLKIQTSFPKDMIEEFNLFEETHHDQQEEFDEEIVSETQKDMMDRFDLLQKTYGNPRHPRTYSSEDEIVCETQKSSPESHQLPLSALKFSLGEVEKATNNFEQEVFELSVDYGKAYYGYISTKYYIGEVVVINFNKQQHYEKLISQNKIMVLTHEYHHVNIISLVGICCDEDKMILVFQFMPNGSSLYDYLHNKQKNAPHLTLEQRLEISLGVAKGLCYLHSGTRSSVVHGKMKTDNIFLDASLVPKISRFRIGEDGYYSSGSYTPPECLEPGYKLSQEADVHAFGVVLLEVLCERKPWDKLLVLALPFILKGELPNATPEHVKKNITPACAWQCEKLIMKCLEFQPDKRPSMNQVVQDLKLALQLQKNKQINTVEQSSGVKNQCQSFSLVVIERAISEFPNPLGHGGYGDVYRGKISRNFNSVDVAIKVLREEGIPTFEIEKKLLSACNHVNIISLLGYCDDKDKKILVYEFMPNGSLYDYLYNPKDDTPLLTVEQRLEICLGVAKGLNYLHSRTDYNIIHSDLKTDNILLDANLVPKIADFGLSRTRDVGRSASLQITNNIKGTPGYIAPECYELNYKLSRKADVYAFGVVLLEVLCQKRGWERLVIWAIPFIAKGELPKFTPEYVVKSIYPECLWACTNLIRDCLETDPNNRPSMTHVIANLDSALTLQKMNVHGNHQKTKSMANNQQAFSLSDIEEATEKFAHQNLLGNPESKFREVRHDRKVYRGKISIDVAVKRMPTKAGPSMDRRSYDLDSEALFQNELNLLSACHHANIISLAGYCIEQDEKILIFEFMANGSLYDHIHTKQDGTIHLTLEKRLDICLGVAKGLGYLHSSNIIHGHLSSKNILLDRNFVPKITGFEFSKSSVEQSTGQNMVRRAYIGMAYQYFGPEYNGTFFKLSQKADVYAFGVIFLEVLCERLARDNLITLALPFIMRGELAKFTPELVGTNISRKCAEACENLLKDCLNNDPVKRPSTNQVVEKLELALKLQKEVANYKSMA